MRFVAGQGGSLRARAASAGDADGGRLWYDSLAGLSRDPIRLCPVMSELYIETFRTSTMIVGSLEQYLFLSAHDNEEGPIRGRFLKFLALSKNR